jgi:replicative DNA helicase
VFEAGGHDLAYLNQLADAAPGVGAKRLRSYADIMLKRWSARELLRLGALLSDEAMSGEGENTETLADKCMERLMAMADGRKVSAGPVHASELAMRFVAHIEALYSGASDAIATHLVDLDKLTSGGGRPGELWVLGARPSMGKTALSGTLARNVAASKGRGAAFFSLEDSTNALTGRHFAAMGRINLADLRAPKNAPADMWDKLAEAADHMSRLNLWIDDEVCSTVKEVRRRIVALKRKGPLSMVVIDYLQLMDDEGDNRNIMLGKIANGLKRLAKELGIWVVLLSQLNREADKRTGPPIMADLRDSGDIEGAADVIGLLHREHRRNPKADKTHCELHIVKHKNGPTDTVHLYFDGSHQRMSNWTGPIPSVVVKKVEYVGKGMS